MGGSIGQNLEILDELILRALGLLVTITDLLTAIGFLVTFVALLVGGAWMILRALLVRLRSLIATDQE